MINMVSGQALRSRLSTSLTVKRKKAMGRWSLSTTLWTLQLKGCDGQTLMRICLQVRVAPSKMPMQPKSILSSNLKDKGLLQALELALSKTCKKTWRSQSTLNGQQSKSKLSTESNKPKRCSSSLVPTGSTRVMHSTSTKRRKSSTSGRGVKKSKDQWPLHKCLTFWTSLQMSHSLSKRKGLTLSMKTIGKRAQQAAWWKTACFNQSCGWTNTNQCQPMIRWARMIHLIEWQGTSALPRLVLTSICPTQIVCRLRLKKDSSETVS